MSVIERQIQVTFRHQVHFTDRVFDLSNPLLHNILTQDTETPRPAKVLIVLDEGVKAVDPDLESRIRSYFEAHPDLKLVSNPLVFEGGERAKNSYFHVSEIHSYIDRFHIDRQSYVVVVGGGALLDMAGLAAATAHRGVRLIRIPTTTLSQDDSGVGVKNGINGFGKKNFVGTFAPPYAVINDFSFIENLSPRDKRAGYVEAVKVACIRDAQFFDWIEQNATALALFDPAAMRPLIHQCAELHMNHIATSGDPFEFGSARPLDFGHWVAHKLEQLSEYKIRHGEAVAIGIAVDVIYSRLCSFLSEHACDRILNLLSNLGFDLFANELFYTDKQGEPLVLKGLEEFREHLGGRLTITLLTSIGVGKEVNEIQHDTVLKAMHEVRTRFKTSQ